MSEKGMRLSSKTWTTASRRRGPVKLITSLGLIALGLALLAAAGCQETRGRERGGAASLPAAGTHANYRYHYYPDSAVYMDTARKLFFYYNGERWMTTTLLPAEIQVDWKNYEVLQMDTDKPYRHHAETVRKYPPGQRKKREGTKTEKE
jgi:hypothetical protein